MRVSGDRPGSLTSAAPSLSTLSSSASENAFSASITAPESSSGSTLFFFRCFLTCSLGSFAMVGLPLGFGQPSPNMVAPPCAVNRTAGWRRPFHARDLARGPCPSPRTARRCRSMDRADLLVRLERVARERVAELVDEPPELLLGKGVERFDQGVRE